MRMARDHFLDSVGYLDSLDFDSLTDNHAALLLDVLAYATFRKEGCQRVNATMLTERCDLIKFVLMQMGLPSGPWRVETLERYDVVPKDSSQFCTVFVDGEERLGVFAPVKPNDEKKSYPRRADKLPVYLGHSVLHTDVQWEQELLMGGDTKPVMVALELVSTSRLPL